MIKTRCVWLYEKSSVLANSFVTYVEVDVRWNPIMASVERVVATPGAATT